MNKSKTLDDLNLVDSFLFSASTEKTQNAELIAKLIIERATGRRIGRVKVESEKYLTGIDCGEHGIRMDLYIMEYDGDNVACVYDIEPNKYRTSELPHRSRYYQAMTDVKLLEVGMPFQGLPEYISIWILTEDPFGQNRMLYTVKNVVEEDSEIRYNDGVTRLFLYVNGECGGTEDLKKLLRYMKYSQEVNVADSEIVKLHEIIQNVRQNREVREHYMTWKEYTDCIIEEGIEEGIKERLPLVVQEAVKERLEEAVKEAVQETEQRVQSQAVSNSIQTLVKAMRKLNLSDEQIVQSLMEEYSLSKEDAKAYVMK